LDRRFDDLMPNIFSLTNERLLAVAALKGYGPFIRGLIL
jgi:hypothetical protein